MELKVREFLENNLSWGLLAAIDGMASKLSLLIIGMLMEKKKKTLGRRADKSVVANMGGWGMKYVCVNKFSSCQIDFMN